MIIIIIIVLVLSSILMIAILLLLSLVSLLLLLSIVVVVVVVAVVVVVVYDLPGAHLPGVLLVRGHSSLESLYNIKKIILYHIIPNRIQYNVI